MAKRIVVPLDGTPLGEAVLPHVAELAQALGASVDLVHVVPPKLARSRDRGPTRPPVGLLGAPTVLPDYSPSATVLGYRYDPDEIESNTRYVERLCVWLRDQGLDASCVVVENPDVAEEVMRRSEGATLLALAASAASPGIGLGRLVYGSISERLLHESATPVLLVRVPSAAS